MNKLELKEIWVEDFSKFISNETYKLLVNKSNKSLEKTTNQLLTSTVKHLIKYSLLHVLSSKAKLPNKTKQQIYEETKNAYNEIKMLMQNAIADGFTLAFDEYAGQYVDYYCKVVPVGPPINKEPI